MKALAAAVLLMAGLVHPGRATCPDPSKTTTLQHNTDLFCNVGPIVMGGFVFRGTPTATSVNTTLPADNKRTDEFQIAQIFKGSHGSNTIDVEFQYAEDGCTYPYDQDGLENVIFGMKSGNTVMMMGCTTTVYSCIDGQSTFNGYSTNDPCSDNSDSGGGGFGF